jgi:hypothetical protein
VSNVLKAIIPVLLTLVASLAVVYGSLPWYSPVATALTAILVYLVPNTPKTVPPVPPVTPTAPSRIVGNL